MISRRLTCVLSSLPFGRFVLYLAPLAFASATASTDTIATNTFSKEGK